MRRTSAALIIAHIKTHIYIAAFVCARAFPSPGGFLLARWLERANQSSNMIDRFLCWRARGLSFCTTASREWLQNKHKHVWYTSGAAQRDIDLVCHEIMKRGRAKMNNFQLRVQEEGWVTSKGWLREGQKKKNERRVEWKEDEGDGDRERRQGGGCGLHGNPEWAPLAHVDDGNAAVSISHTRLLEDLQWLPLIFLLLYSLTLTLTRHNSYQFKLKPSP